MQNPVATWQSHCILAKVPSNMVKSRAPISSTFPVHAAAIPGTTLWVASLWPHSLENNHHAEQKPQWFAGAGQARLVDLDSNTLFAQMVIVSFQSLKISVIEIMSNPAWGLLDLCSDPLPKLFNLPLKLVFLFLGDTCSWMYFELLHGRVGLMASDIPLFYGWPWGSKWFVSRFPLQKKGLPTHPPLLP